MVLADFDVRTSPEELTPLLVAASYNRENAVLWLLQDAWHKIMKDAVDTDRRNAIHLASLDLQCQYTIEVSSYLLLSHMYIRVQPTKFIASLDLLTKCLVFLRASFSLISCFNHHVCICHASPLLSLLLTRSLVFF